MTQQLHEDVRAVRASVERLAERMTDLQTQVAGLQAHRDFQGQALQALIRSAVVDALREHEQRVNEEMGLLAKRVEVLEQEHHRRQGLTDGGRLALTLAQVPGVGAFIYLVIQWITGRPPANP